MSARGDPAPGDCRSDSRGQPGTARHKPQCATPGHAFSVCFNKIPCTHGAIPSSLSQPAFPTYRLPDFNPVHGKQPREVVRGKLRPPQHIAARIDRELRRRAEIGPFEPATVEFGCRQFAAVERSTGQVALREQASRQFAIVETGSGHFQFVERAVIEPRANKRYPEARLHALSEIEPRKQAAVENGFAQVYRINLTPKIRRNPTIRLVILDEAFSKMDAEKVASCIELIRGLGFQAIISATNDKIQNYVENVDKTFVFANPSKKSISIQAFEKDRMKDLASEMDEEA